ncbi:alpha/beta hydrolase [Rhodococcus sp. SC4]|nr:alpha/beta hydrolase [Rhodococcus sp. SC4]
MTSVGGRRTRIRDEGKPTDPPVLLLHGIGRSLEDWSLQFSRLSESHRVISLDLPGSGFSARAAAPTTLEVLAQGVLDTLDAIGERRPVHVVGNSLGGAVAMQLSVLEPERVAGLVLVNSAGFGQEAALPLRLLAVPILGEMMGWRTTRTSARIAERLSFADPRLATEARVDHALAITQQPDTGTVVLETARALATFRGSKAEWRMGLLTAVAPLRHPTLIIWGDRDRILPAHHLDAARRALPYAETELFAGIGHMPQIECPDKFAARVLAFFETVEGTADFARSDVSETRQPRRRRTSAARKAESR